MPDVVIDYNLTMGGIDRADQALVSYPTTPKRYYVRIFYHLLDMAIWNAFILRKKQLLSTTPNFHKQLVERIVEKFTATTPQPTEQ